MQAARHITAWCCRSQGPACRRLKRWLDELLWEDNAAKRDIYRMKGGISIVGSDSQHVLQASPPACQPRQCLHAILWHVHTSMAWPSLVIWRDKDRK